LKQSRVWVIARRPLLLALVLGCGISVLASGRFTVRLIVDGALSFAFVPVCELVAFAVVYRLGRTSLPFSHAVDRFFAGNTPWLWWLIAIMTAAALLPVTREASLLAPMLITTAVPIVLSVRFDLRFFREVMGSPRGRARIDVALQRIVSWSAATAYFFGVAIGAHDFFYQFGYLFVEMWDLIAGWAAELA
jgi:hypothetical protein